MSSTIGWDVVPPTLLRDGPLGPGMCQLWIDEERQDEPPLGFVPSRQVPAGWRRVTSARDDRGRPYVLAHADDPRLARMAVFDAVVNNADRKGGHVIATVDGQLYGVDHGICFHVEDKLRTVLWGWAGDRLPDESVELLGKLSAELDGSSARRWPRTSPRWRSAIWRSGSTGCSPPAASRNRAVTGRRSRGRRSEPMIEPAPPAPAARTTLAAMDSWSAHEVPMLPGAGGTLALFDSARREVVPTVDADEGRAATMYVCGITPYDATHLGHAATMITFDLVQRAWRDSGVPVRYVQNVTDIDDPLLERAARDREDWVVLAMRETALFREDMEALRILPPERYVGAVESIPDIAARVVDLSTRARRTGSTTAPATCTSTSPARPGSATSRTCPGRRCCGWPPSGAATPAVPASGTRSTRCCGAAPATASRPGPAVCSARAAPAGTSSAR